MFAFQLTNLYFEMQEHGKKLKYQQRLIALS